MIFVITLIPIYFTYFRYQNFTANASQIIWILIHHLRYGCRHLVSELRVTWLKLLGSFFWFQKNESALAGTNRLVKDRSRKWRPIPERSLSKLAPVSRDLIGKVTTISFRQRYCEWSKNQTCCNLVQWHIVQFSSYTIFRVMRKNKGGGNFFSENSVAIPLSCTLSDIDKL